MYAYLLVAVVILFALFKYDIKELLKVQVGDKVSDTMELKGTGSGAGGASGGGAGGTDPDWSKFVLKSSIAACPKSGAGADALQFSSDSDFKSIEDCYSKNKPPGADLKWRDFVKCINNKHPTACPKPGKITVPMSGSTNTNTNTKKKSDDNFLAKLLSNFFN